MNCKYSEKTAIKCGINSALIAGYLWDNMVENGAEHHSMEWIRCGKKSICAVFPFMGVSGRQRFEKIGEGGDPEKSRIQR